MEANVTRRGDYLIVSMSGRLELEPVEVFRQHCFSHLKSEKFIFNLRGLSFVGSTGITSFLDILSQLVKMESRPLKVVSASSEYVRIFSSHLENQVEFYASEDLALQSFIQPVIHNQIPDFIEETVDRNDRVSASEAAIAQVLTSVEIEQEELTVETYNPPSLPRVEG